MAFLDCEIREYNGREIIKAYYIRKVTKHISKSITAGYCVETNKDFSDIKDHEEIVLKTILSNIMSTSSLYLNGQSENYHDMRSKFRLHILKCLHCR